MSRGQTDRHFRKHRAQLSLWPPRWPSLAEPRQAGGSLLKPLVFPLSEQTKENSLWCKAVVAAGVRRPPTFPPHL